MRAPVKPSRYTRNAAPHARTLSRAEARKLFDHVAQRNLGMSGDEFLARYDAGEIRDPDRPEVIRVLMLRPFANR